MCKRSLRILNVNDNKLMRGYIYKPKSNNKNRMRRMNYVYNPPLEKHFQLQLPHVAGSNSFVRYATDETMWQVLFPSYVERSTVQVYATQLTVSSHLRSQASLDPGFFVPFVISSYWSFWFLHTPLYSL